MRNVTMSMQKREPALFQLPGPHTAHMGEARRSLWRLREILAMKRNGDWEQVGRELSITAFAAEKAFHHPALPLHSQVVASLEDAIESRLRSRNSA